MFQQPISFHFTCLTSSSKSVLRILFLLHRYFKCKTRRLVLYKLFLLDCEHDVLFLWMNLWTYNLIAFNIYGIFPHKRFFIAENGSLDYFKCFKNVTTPLISSIVTLQNATLLYFATFLCIHSFIAEWAHAKHFWFIKTSLFIYMAHVIN